VGSLTRRRLVLASAFVLLAACGDDDATDADVADGDVTVSGAWARASAPGQNDGAVYFELEADEDDTLLTASVPASVAGDAEMHEEVADEQGRMTMRELADGLDLAGSDTTVFEPGGLHVMLVDLARPLAAGESFEMTLDFASAGPLTVSVTIAESAP
jgi:periplasmic copper chaperone A